MDQHQPLFDRIETALKTLDASTDARIKSVDERLQALGVPVETYLADPVDTWETAEPRTENALHLGYARNAGRFGLTLKRVRAVHRAGAPATTETEVQPLRAADRATRIAVVDKLPELLSAVEAELARRNARIPSAVALPAAASSRPQPEPRRIEVAAARPAAPEIALPPASDVDVALGPPPAPARPVKAAPHAMNAAPAQDSVDHMFRLFGRKGK